MKEGPPYHSATETTRLWLQNSGKDIVIVLTIFVISRIIFAFAGVRFNASTLSYYWQYIDPMLLRNRLWESIYYLHQQPPLFNLALGIVLRVFGTYSHLAFKLLSVMMELVFSASFLSLLARMGVTRIVRIALCTIFIVSPAFVLYANWLFYEFPSMVLLCVTTLALHRFTSRATFARALLFFSLLATLILTRSIYHVLLLIVSIALLIALLRHRTKTILAAACLPVLFVLAVDVKTFVQFGSFTPGDVYVGQNLGIIARSAVPLSRLEKMVQQKKISPIMLIDPFSAVSTYQAFISLPKTGIPVLDQGKKQHGYPNMNNAAYLRITELYAEGAKQVAKAYPREIANVIVVNFSHYFLPAENVWPFPGSRNETVLQPYTTVFSELFYGFSEMWGFGIWIAIGVPVLLYFGLRRLVSDIRRGKIDVRAEIVTLAFMLITMSLVTASSVLTPEAERWRFQLDPLYLVLLGMLLTEMTERIKGMVRLPENTAKNADVRV